ASVTVWSSFSSDRATNIPRAVSCSAIRILKVIPRLSAGLFPACRDTISSNGVSWQDIALIFLRLYFDFGTPIKLSFKLGTQIGVAKISSPHFAISSLEWQACPLHAGKKRWSTL